jgi:hypothetical protein
VFHLVYPVLDVLNRLHFEKRSFAASPGRHALISDFDHRNHCAQARHQPLSCLSRLFEPPPDHPRKHINTHTLALDFTSRFVFCVCWNQDRLSIHLPPARRSHEFRQSLALQVQPNAQQSQIDLAEGLSHLAGNAYPYQVFEACNICIEVGV